MSHDSQPMSHDSHNPCHMTHTTMSHDSHNPCHMTHTTHVTWHKQPMSHDTHNPCHMTQTTHVTWHTHRHVHSTMHASIISPLPPPSPNLTLDQRVEYISRAVMCAKSCNLATSGSSIGEFLHELEDKMEVRGGRWGVEGEGWKVEVRGGRWGVEGEGWKVRGGRWWSLLVCVCLCHVHIKMYILALKVARIQLNIVEAVKSLQHQTSNTRAAVEMLTRELMDISKVMCLCLSPRPSLIVAASCKVLLLVSKVHV